MDEHGLKIEMKSKKLNINSKKYVDEICEYYKKMNSLFNIDIDIFYRTSNTFHKCFVQKIWSYLLNTKCIYKDVYKGYYDINEERYLSETELSKRLITKGDTGEQHEIYKDQEKKKEKEKQKQKHKEADNIIYIEEPNSYFFNILKFKQFLIDFYENNKTFLYPSYLRKEILYILKNELKDICISRYNTKWGVQIPTEKTGTIYVWFDALLSYVSAILYYQKKGKKENGEKNEKTGFNSAPISTSSITDKTIESVKTNDSDYDVFLHVSNKKEKEKEEEEEEEEEKRIKEQTHFIHRIWSPDVQIIGRDILKFHCVLYICLLKSLHLDLPKKIVCHGLITNDNMKMSKSLNNVVSPFDIIKNYFPDVIRMYFIGCSNIYEDKNYSEQNVKSFESFLRNNIGNLLYRVISLCMSKNVQEILKIDETTYKNSAILKECILKKEEFVKLIDNLEYPYFIEKIMTLIKNVNKYFVQMEPWKLGNQETKKFHIIIYETLESVKWFSVFLYPIIPQISLKILNMLGLSTEESAISFSLLETATPKFVLKKLTKLI